ncbi:MAG TPA: hypothetical protein VGP33_10820 [Chloroflexota bacterium]|jgi:hypothetical protein|nr:hypothetical protein [Chloroflexota bacterium]
MAERKSLLLRLDPAVYDALARWAGDELRSINAQIEFALRRALADAGRSPESAGSMPRRGRPAKIGTTADSGAKNAGVITQAAPRPGVKPADHGSVR